MDHKLSIVYYSPKGYWKGLAAVMTLAKPPGYPMKWLWLGLKSRQFGRYTCHLRAIFRVLCLMKVAQMLSIRLTYFFHRTIVLPERRLSTL